MRDALPGPARQCRAVRRLQSLRSVLLILCLALVGQAASAALCSVPSASHPTVGAAVRDVACTTIQLAMGDYPENLVLSRGVAIEGVSASATTLSGAVEAGGPATDASLARLSLDGTAAGVAGCWPSLLRTTGGARLTATDGVSVTNSGISSGACRIFADGFESSGVLAWSAASP